MVLQNTGTPHASEQALAWNLRKVSQSHDLSCLHQQQLIMSEHPLSTVPGVAMRHPHPFTKTHCTTHLASTGASDEGSPRLRSELVFVGMKLCRPNAAVAMGWSDRCL